MTSAKATAALIRKKTPQRVALAMVLGSGFQHALSELKVETEIPFAQLPGFPSVGVSGHAGKFIIGHFEKTPVIVLKGRAHYYEGHEIDKVAFPIRVLAEMGIRAVLLTNAAGGINRRFKPGDFMGITDHINLMGINPLRGPAIPGRGWFVDLTDLYDPSLLKTMATSAKAAKLNFHTGVYMAVSGPSYETPAEIRAFEKLGADAIGMSTVPEAIVARQCGLAVAAVSCITNKAAGLSKGPLSHRDVLNSAEQRKHEVARFLTTFAQRYGGG